MRQIHRASLNAFVLINEKEFGERDEKKKLNGTINVVFSSLKPHIFFFSVQRNITRTGSSPS